ncbi:hypothetical protein BDP27DRAFT_1368791 [Rhodocollybia butyracea]|uniref:Uncharacterized protein n=1 Tax=Rhodocollybia butyracea TaxID=206335 RepID=A0A9P5PFN7_9AGAR|nr:hypothetical protein BDP27DRAFT_1368791 [Rhodocollybia butyracea]
MVKHIYEYTPGSVKQRDPSIAELTHRYNKLCNDMQRLLQLKTQAPRNSVAPLKIEMEGLFDLDIDDIWLDISLGYEEQDDTIPLLWLSNNQLGKQNAMQEWFNEEWQVVHASMERVGDNLPEWGPSEDKTCMHQAVHSLYGGVEAIEEFGFNYDVKSEQEAGGHLVEHLASLTISKNYRDQQSNLILEQ